jgi:hypothetical protein
MDYSIKKMNDTEILYEDYFNVLDSKVKEFTESIWLGRVEGIDTKRWLENFSDKEKKINALYLLSNFMFFGIKELRELLVSLYRDKYKSEIIMRIRKNNKDTTNLELIEKLFNKELKKTRFIGIGNPSESGAHLLYYFRQVNKLSKKLFTDFKILDKNINRYVFIDDFSGTGSQAIKFYKKYKIQQLKKDNPNKEFWFLCIGMTEKAYKEIKAKTNFDRVEYVLFFNNSFKCFETESRYYNEKQIYKGIEKDFAKNMCEEKRLLPSDYEHKEDYNPLGFKKSQLLLAFEHNTPNNTLPIFWFEDQNWYPIFKRFVKVYKEL